MLPQTISLDRGSILPALTGTKLASRGLREVEMLLTGDLISAQDAFRISLVNRVVRERARCGLGARPQDRREVVAANYMFLGYYPEMAWDDGLVGTAREIAATDRTPLRVMAGPGTGKSFAMKRRVARLLEGGHRQLFANAAIAASRVAS